ncbi:MAG: MmcQ/YjbR family DNA-binding protein [Aeromicrobium sp.]
MAARELELMRKVAIALPGVTEHRSHDAPCFFVSTMKPLCYFHDNHRDDHRISVWCPLPPGVAQELADAEPDRFFRPTPSAGGVFANWVGLFIDGHGGDETDWGEIAALLEDAYRHVAPKYLIDELDRRQSSS